DLAVGGALHHLAAGRDHGAEGSDVVEPVAEPVLHAPGVIGVGLALGLLLLLGLGLRVLGLGRLDGLLLGLGLRVLGLGRLDGLLLLAVQDGSLTDEDLVGLSVSVGDRREEFDVVADLPLQANVGHQPALGKGIDAGLVA